MAGPFTPSPSCTTDIYYVSNPSGSYFHLGPPTSTAACFPRSWSPSASAFISTSYCPSGYTIACANTAFPEKTGTCCPGGFGCQTKTTGGLPWQSTELCVAPMPTSSTYVYTTQAPGRAPQRLTTTGTGGTINAFGVEIRWSTTDSGKTKTKTQTTTKSPTVKTAAPTAKVTNSTSHASRPNRLSTGAKAGIGVGAAIAFLLLLAGAFFLWWRKRKSKSGVKDAEMTRDAPSRDDFPPEKTTLGPQGPEGPAAAAGATSLDHQNERSSVPDQQNIAEPEPGRQTDIRA
ncbi:hypothetical protein GGS26DRAFT_525618 [Hypomontagnella submonticulosa]|nr:hypothetical protein GGS26DRAFT_525618 [Hypomontagnella submonticulosa]